MKIGKDGVGSNPWWNRLNYWAVVIRADFQTDKSYHLQNISSSLFSTAEKMLRIIIIQNVKLIQACLSSKVVEVWIDRFCVRYDWWRWLQLK